MSLIRNRKYSLNPLVLMVSVGILNTLLFNHQALQFTTSHVSGTSLEILFFSTSIVAIITSLFILALIPFYVFNLGRSAIFIFFYFGAVTSYFSNKFGIVYDSTVVKSFFSTNFDEFSQYWNIKLFLYLSSLTLLTLFLFFKIEIRKEKDTTRLWPGTILAICCLASIFIFSFIQYKELSSFLRNHRHVRQMVVPLSPFYEFTKIVRSNFYSKDGLFLSIGIDAKKMNRPKQIFVMVVGETARGDHFSINGYRSNLTNPLLSKRNVVTYTNVSSCGTATAISLPCMFSNIGRAEFTEDKAKSTENILDVAKRAGYETFWMDNNTGCKGVCTRTKNIDISDFKSTSLCNGTSCFDEILIEGLKKNLNTESDQFIVLHMLGSHGPSYYLRYPKEFEKFLPSCPTSDLSSCTKESIVNTYDNTILYTDYVLDQLIEVLENISLKTNIQTSLLYVSDHGESLGENGVYLHSLPYFIAPDEQKNAAIIYWDSKKSNVKIEVKTKPVSHDYIFSTVLKILNINTKLYNKDLDLLRIEN